MLYRIASWECIGDTAASFIGYCEVAEETG